MITYNLFGDAYLLEEFSGKVDEREFVSLKKSELQKTDYHQIKGIVMDFRKIEIRFNKKLVDRFVDFIVRNKNLIANKSIAILTKTMHQLSFGYSLKERLNRHSIPVQIEQFSSKQAAYTWLQAGKH